MRMPYRFMFWSSGVGIGACLQEGLTSSATGFMWWASMFLLMLGFAWSPKKQKEPEQHVSLEKQAEQHMLDMEAQEIEAQEIEAQRIKDATPRFTKWSSIADKISARFYVAGVMNSTACHGPEGSRALRAVIMEMGKKLDTAVDKAWAEAPSPKVIERTRDLGGE